MEHELSSDMTFSKSWRGLKYHTHAHPRKRAAKMSNHLTKIYILRRYYNGRMCEEKKQTVMNHDTMHAEI